MLPRGAGRGYFRRGALVAAGACLAIGVATAAAVLLPAVIFAEHRSRLTNAAPPQLGQGCDDTTGSDDKTVPAVNTAVTPEGISAPLPEFTFTKATTTVTVPDGGKVRRCPPVAGDQQGPAQHLLHGRLVVKRDAKRIRGDYELLIELENGCGHAAEFNFDPKDLTVELRDDSGKAIPEERTLHRSGPIPQPHQGVIPCGASVTVPTHRGGVGFGGGTRLFAAGWQIWYLTAGKYTVKGCATVSLKHGEKYIEPLLPSRRSPQWQKLGVLPTGKEARVALELAETTFEVVD